MMTVPNRAAMTEVEFPPRELNATDPFAFGDPELIESILGDAGWGNVQIEPRHCCPTSETAAFGSMERRR
ncbi:MAG: hypothetical protein ACI8Y4_000220 [Candidatus Poriferisodalaceae bacterium]